ncbi:PREDICTED: transcription factor bHLH103-like [Tarenaya hassleriana]|uniref:transcription factor bHLH103-like n=1 Tax=Tarenaya hassleriana TaxID=28532 RepID=UPI00053C2E6F|nr:PREDICTED: transcription factor bHLH103-like [Tarenaya hassleriana]
MTEEFERTGMFAGTWWNSSNHVCSWKNFDLLDPNSDISLDSTSQVSPFELSSPVPSPPDWNQSTIHGEGYAEAKFNPNTFFEGLFEPHEQFSSSCPRTEQTAKPEFLDSLAFFENVLFDDSGVVSIFRESEPEEEHRPCKNFASEINDEKTEDLEGYDEEESPQLKRPRIETPSPLPSFKVRKEKLGDRITTLQQLVSPFGKTDTASVLNEAVEYIKFLHEQVTILSNPPQLKSGAPVQRQPQISDRTSNRECKRQDLRSRGLSLMPISSTFQMNTSDLWNLPFV